MRFFIGFIVYVLSMAATAYGTFELTVRYAPELAAYKAVSEVGGVFKAPGKLLDRVLPHTAPTEETDALGQARDIIKGFKFP